jgi:thiol-disulfide isomerase/thioredoxin
MRIAEIAYPLDPEDLNPSYVDSVLTYMETVATQHPHSGVQGEFLYKALSVAHAVGRTSAVQDYHERLISEYGQTDYAKRAEEYAPERPIQAGKQIPDFEFPTLTDTTEMHSRAEFTGEVVLIDFWGTWCGPCIVKMPQLHEAYRKYRDEGFEILSVAMHNEQKDVREFRSKKWEMPWKHAFIPEGSKKEKDVISRFGVQSFPTPILINEKGTIIATKQELAKKELANVLGRFFDDAE